MLWKENSALETLKKRTYRGDGDENGLSSRLEGEGARVRGREESPGERAECEGGTAIWQFLSGGSSVCEGGKGKNREKE